MQATQTGKTVYFLWALWLSLPFTVAALFTRRYGKINPLSIIDLLFLVWVAWIAFRALLQGRGFTFQWAGYAGLVLLYFMLRLLPHAMQWWLLAALIVSGLAQAVYGNLQLWGVYPSHHGIFKLTGGFFNPGPYAGYLAALFPLALWIWLALATKGQNCKSAISETLPCHRGIKASISQVKTYIADKGLAITAAAALLCMALVLPASQSRAAWVAIAVSAAWLLWQAGTAQRWWSGFRLPARIKTALPALAVIILFCGMAGLYLLKKDSANGRLFIYHNTLAMIADKPLTGHGSGGFAANYMHCQAAFFAQNPEAPQAWQAGDNHYAFNEYLRHAAEYGLAGLGLMLVLLVVAFTAKPAKNMESNRAEGSPLILPARAALLSVAVFALTSYPSDILPITIVAVWALATIARETSAVKQTKRGIKTRLNLALFPKAAALVLAGFLLATMPGYINPQTTALKTWDRAFMLYGMGSYIQSIEAYAKIWTELQNNGAYLTNYGKALSMAGQHPDAIEILLRAAQTQPSTVVYTALGDSHKALGQTNEAEAAYLYAWHMAPARFYPQYLLALLYDETGQHSNAIATARYLLQKEVKVPSKAIDEIHEAMRAILEKHSGAGYLPGMKNSIPAYTAPVIGKNIEADKQTEKNKASIISKLNIPEKYLEAFKGQQNKTRGAYRSVVPTGKFLLQFW
jgi:O-antigen ligase